MKKRSNLLAAPLRTKVFRKILLLRRLLRGLRLPWGSAIRAAAGAALGTRRTYLVHGDFAIAVFVESLERGGGVRNFAGINDAVLIYIQRSNNRRSGTAARAGLAGLTVSVLRSVARRAGIVCDFGGRFRTR